MKQMVKILQAAVMAALLILLLGVTGCKTWMKMRYGITAPHEESPASLLKFLHRNGFPTSNIYVFRDSSAYLDALRNRHFRENLLSYMVFDSLGNLLVRDTTKCQWAGGELLTGLNPDSTYLTTQALRSDSLLNRIIPLAGAPHSGEVETKPDFTVIITWARFLGKYNYRLFDLRKAADTNTKASLRLIWLNADMQKSWDLHREQRLQLTE